MAMNTAITIFSQIMAYLPILEFRKSVKRYRGTYKVKDFTTANFDMIRHYRPHQNVVTRPVAPGRGHEVTGHHEILLPLLRQAVIEGLAAAGHQRG